MSAREYLTLIKEQGWLIALCVVLGLGIAGILIVTVPPTYASQTSYYIASASTAVDVTATDNYSGAQLSAERVKSYSELVKGGRVAAEASALLQDGTTPAQIQDSVTTDSVTETVILNVTVTGPDPAAATQRANAVSSAFTTLVGRLETTRGPQAPPSVLVQVVQPPSEGVVVAPRPVLYLLVGGVFGLIVGFGVAVARRSLVRSVTRATELEDITRSPVLASVPADRRTPRTPMAAADAEKPSPALRARAEAYQRARTNLEFANIDRDRCVLVVTSALHDEGKTTTTCNLARALAATGHRVVVVDADLRRPMVMRTLALDPSPGMTAVLRETVSLDEALQTWNGSFDVLASGDSPPRPNELLASRRVGELVRALGARYDYVLLDAPPLLPVADAATLGRHVDAAVLVCRSGRTSKDSLRDAVAALRAVAVPLVGAVLSHSPAPPDLKKARPLDDKRSATAGEAAEQHPVPAARTESGTHSEAGTPAKPVTVGTVPLREISPRASGAAGTGEIPVPAESVESARPARDPDPDPGEAAEHRPRPRPSRAPAMAASRGDGDTAEHEEQNAAD